MRLRSFLLALFVAWIPLLLVSGVTGCSCSTDPNQAKLDEVKKKVEEEKKKKAKPKPDIELGTMNVQPNNLVDKQFFLKPRHLTSVSVDAIANNFNINGELLTDPLDLTDVPFRLGNARPAILPKEQKRSLEMMLQYPELTTETRDDLGHFSCRLNGDGGRMLINSRILLTRMPSYQFYFFVLAKSQDSYKFLSQLPSFRPNFQPNATEDPYAFYRLVLPPVIQRTPLPSSPLAWTNTAYVLWDDMPADSLNAEQKQALIDWLHWGGQLIVNGPGTLPLLKQSFLEPYLPVEAGGTIKLELPDFQSLQFAEGKGWAGPVRLNKPWECLELKPKREAEDHVLAWTGNENGRVPLLVERQLGRGRIVVSAFRLNQPEMAEWRDFWPMFDEIFNGFVLRRRPRAWHDLNDIQDSVGLAWRADRGQLLAQSPHEVSRIGFFSRDTAAGNYKPAHRKLLEPAPTNDLDRFEGAGPGAWDDFNDVAQSARNAIEEAAGINVPKRMFVVQVMAMYLLVLVPLNWIVFGLLRRLEWAWIAVPIITVVFTGVVVKMAELNIGFARSRTEVAVVEVQGEHTRAHLTRYTALYTSLSTRYDVRMADATGVVQPLSGKDKLAEFLVNSRRQLWLHRDDKVWLEGFDVSSNSRGILHAEQMFPLGGSFKVLALDDVSVKVANESDHDLHDVQVIGPHGLARLGELPAGGAAEGKFTEVAPIKPEVEQPDDDPGAASAKAKKTSSDGVRLDDLLAIARHVDDKSVRLVGWSDEPLKGMDIEPEASQNRHANVFVVHLRPAPSAKAEPDAFAGSAKKTFLTKPKPQEPVDFNVQPPDNDPFNPNQ